MLEFYWSYADYRDLMTLTEQMLAETGAGGARRPRGALRRSHDLLPGAVPPPVAARRGSRGGLCQAGRAVDVAVLRSRESAAALAQRLGVAVEPGAGAGHIAASLFEALCEHDLVQPTFVYDFPTEGVAALEAARR
jgi:lysyl-tRNA synthetase class 2